MGDTTFSQYYCLCLLYKTARVIALQATTTVSHFLTDQLEAEMKREQLIKEGKLTEKEADEQNEKWEQVSNYVWVDIRIFAVMHARSKDPLLKSEKKACRVPSAHLKFQLVP